MGLWTDTPYELQSPAWRHAMNGGKSSSSGSGWNPTLNPDKAAEVLNAYQAAKSAKSARSGGTGTTVTTVQRDGGAGFLNALSGFGQAMLSGMGAASDAPPPQVYPASYGGGTTGMDAKTMLIFAAAGLGIYLLATK